MFVLPMTLTYGPWYHYYQKLTVFPEEKSLERRPLLTGNNVHKTEAVTL